MQNNTENGAALDIIETELWRRTPPHLQAILVGTCRPILHVRDVHKCEAPDGRPSEVSDLPESVIGQ